MHVQIFLIGGHAGVSCNKNEKRQKATTNHFMRSKDPKNDDAIFEDK